MSVVTGEHRLGASTFFWNSFARRYAKQPLSNPAAYEEKLDRTREHLTPSSRILEIGCGTGSTALIHAPSVAQIDAWDTSRKMIDIARNKARDGGVQNVAFEVGTIFDTRATPGSYDVTLALNLLHLISDRNGQMEATIARAHELLVDGGVLITSTACLDQMNPLIRGSLLIPGALGLLPRVNIFSRAELRQRITRAGFEMLTEATPGGRETVFTISRKRSG